MPKHVFIVVGVLLTAVSATAQSKPSGVITPPEVSTTTILTEPLVVEIPSNAPGAAITAVNMGVSGGFGAGDGIYGSGSTGVIGRGFGGPGGHFTSYWDIGAYASGGRNGLEAECWGNGEHGCVAVRGIVSRGGGPYSGGPGTGIGVYGDGGLYGVYGVADDSAVVGHKTYAGFFDGNVHVGGELDAPIIQRLQAQIANLTARLAALEGGSTPRGTLVPARIQAEDYDQGGQGVGYSDTTLGNTGGAYRTEDVDIKPSSEGGFAVGWIMNGEWLAYTVNVPTAGAYTLTARVGSAMSGRSFRITVDGVDATGLKAVPQTANWDQYGNVSTIVQLQAGTHVLRFVPATDWIDFQWLDVTP